MSTLRKAAEALPFRMEEREPNVLLTEFGEHSVNFEVHVWVTEPWLGRRWMSELNQAIWWALEEEDITIAFPQLDVHFDPAVTRTIEKWRPAD